jgi:isopentenyl-diphosphate delta-isomerase
MWLGLRDAILLFVVLGVLALAIETTAIITGFPYGHFGYSDLLGYRLFGYAPWTVAFAWTPLVLAAYAIAAQTFKNTAVRIVTVALVLFLFDIVLDPGAVHLGFWKYAAGGGFYGVPLSNFVGWLVSGAIAGAVLELFTRWKRPLLPVPAQLISSGFLIVFFWTALAGFAGLWWAFIVGVIMITALSAFYFVHKYAFDDMVVYVDELGTPIGTELKPRAHNSKTHLHSAFSVFIFNKKGELLLQQRAMTKKTWPGVWSNSCCGHVMLHESPEKAVRRRLKHELGLNVGELHLVLPHFRYRAEKDGVVENEICPVFVGVSDTQPKPNPTEVHDTRWVDWEDFKTEVADPEKGYSPWAIEEVELLAKDEKLHRLLQQG